MQQSGNLSLYIHVPFCTRKCDYCHFYVVPHKKELVTLYLKALREEIALAHESLLERDIISLYFGGGTPSLLTIEEVESILLQIRPYLKKEIEITFEANPESLSKKKVEELKAMGINRISLGIQSFNDQELVLLSRQHGSSVAERAVWAAKEGGIENLSIDLIYDLPSQNELLFKRSLEKATKLPITHLSLYNLTIEPHTIFYKKRAQLEQAMPQDEESLALLEVAEIHLESYGLKRYEISAFAKEGYESLHNSGYWTGREYLGFGPSAHSFYRGERMRNQPNLHRWAGALEKKLSPVDFSEKLSPSAALKERLAIGLRFFRGVTLEEGMVTDELLSLEREGFVLIQNNLAKLTKRGRLFYDHVAETLIEID